MFPNIWWKPSLEQLEAVSSYPTACYLGTETNPHLATASLQGAVESDKVSSELYFFQAKQAQLPQLFLITLVLWTLHQLLLCPSMDMFQHLNVFQFPKLNTGFELWPHQYQVGEKNVNIVNILSHYKDCLIT